ncbi:hypothetical protein V2J09_012434 [Rumex salicifolius]
MEEDRQSDKEIPLLQPKRHPDDVAADSSFFKTCFNGLNALSGVGILSIPYALSSGGWLSLGFLFLIASISFYAGLLIKRCMEIDPNIRTYPDIGEHAFGQFGRTLASTFMCMELYLVVTGFLILEGDNLHKLFPQFSININQITIGGKEGFIIILALIILPSVWLDSMSILSYVSASGVLASSIILGSIMWSGAFDGIGFHERGEVINLKGIPIATSLYAFCYCAHPVFPTLYTSMRKKHHFSQVLFICFFWSTITYASMAIIGYLMFGSNVQSQITLNLSTLKLSSKVAIYTTLVNPMSKFALMISPVVSAIESCFPRMRKKRTFRLLIRTTLVLSNVVVALTVPFFAYLMSLVGAFLSITASITLPCLCYLKIDSGCGKSERVVIVGVVFFSVVIVVFGTYSSLAEIIQEGITFP